jgi:hypothetical protein
MMSVFILEDITPGVQAQRDWETPGGLAPISECMFMGQKLDIGVVIVSHTLSGLSPIIRQNVGTWMVTGLPGEDPRLVCNVLGMDLKQADKARTLQPGELVCLNPVLLPKPVYARFPMPAIPGICSEAMRKSTVERFLKNVHTAPAAPMSSFRPRAPVEIPSAGAAAQQKAPELPARSLAFMVHVATSTLAAMMKIYDRLALGCTQGRRVTKGLADIGLIRIHTFSTGKKGGQVGLIEITDSGWELLKKKGLLPPKRRTSGDWEHETAAKLIELEGARLGYRVSFEAPLGGIQADVQ